MDENSEVELALFDECTDQNCIPSPLDGSSEIVCDLKQQVQSWRQKHDECVKQIETLNNSVYQTRSLFCKEIGALERKNKTLEDENAIQKCKLADQDQKSKEIQFQKEKELNVTICKQKECIEQQECKINSLKHKLEDARHKLDENSDLLKNAEDKIQAYEKQMASSTESSIATCSTGVSLSEIQRGCKACVKITKELDDLKLKYNELTSDLESKGNEKSVSDLTLIKEKCQQQKNLLTDFTLKCERLKQENQQLQEVTEKLNALEIQHDKSLNYLEQKTLENVQLIKDNESLQSELILKKTELKDLRQINVGLKNQVDKVKREQEELSRSLEEANLRMRKYQRRLMYASKFKSLTGNEVRNKCRARIKITKLRKNFSQRYRYRRRNPRVGDGYLMYRSRVSRSHGNRMTSKAQYSTI